MAIFGIKYELFQAMKLILSDEKVPDEFYTYAVGAPKEQLQEIYENIKSREAFIENKPEKPKEQTKKDQESTAKWLKKAEMQEMIAKYEKSKQTKKSTNQKGSPTISEQKKIPELTIHLSDEEYALLNKIDTRYQILSKFNRLAKKGDKEYRSNFAYELGEFIINTEYQQWGISDEVKSINQTLITEQYLVPELIKSIDNKLESVKKKGNSVVQQNIEFFTTLAKYVLLYDDVVKAHYQNQNL